METKNIFDKFIDDLVDHLTENEVLFAIPGYFFVTDDVIRHALKDFAFNGRSSIISEHRALLEKKSEETLNELMRRRRTEKEKRLGGHVYLIESRGLYKIGRSSKIEARFKTYTTENPHGVKLLAHKHFDDCHAEEARLHSLYSGKRKIGEWFALSPAQVKKIIQSLL